MSPEELRLLDAYWRAANYLSVGQIYLLDNPLLREPLRAEHVKPRLLGHWGTTPGPELRLRAPEPRRSARATSTRSTSPGPATAARRSSPTPTSRAPTARSTRTSARTRTGCSALFRQFSFPGGIPSHVAPETPGSIHEGGELGYSLAHAYGAAFDNPDLLVVLRRRRRRGRDRPARGELALEQVPRTRRRDGAVLPILHLNGYKIANPTVLARIPERRAASRCSRATATSRCSSPATSPSRVHQQLAAALDEALDEIARDPAGRARDGDRERPRWPMIVLRTPKGWTGPKEVDGMPVEGTWRAHQVPLADVARRTPSTCAARGVDAQLPARGAVRRRRRARARSSPRWRRAGERRMSANPHANGGLLLRDLALPDFRDYAVDGRDAGRERRARRRACSARSCAT